MLAVPPLELPEDDHYRVKRRLAPLAGLPLDAAKHSDEDVRVGLILGCPSRRQRRDSSWPAPGRQGLALDHLASSPTSAGLRTLPTAASAWAISIPALIRLAIAD